MKCIHAAGMFAALVFSGCFFFLETAASAPTVLFLRCYPTMFWKEMSLAIFAWTLVLGSNGTNGEVAPLKR